VYVLHACVSVGWQEALWPFHKITNTKLDLALGRCCWDHIVHRYLDDHDYRLQEYLATAGLRGVETEHVAVQ